MLRLNDELSCSCQGEEQSDQRSAHSTHRFPCPSTDFESGDKSTPIGTTAPLPADATLILTTSDPQKEVSPRRNELTQTSDATKPKQTIRARFEGQAAVAATARRGAIADIDGKSSGAQRQPTVHLW